MRTTNFDALAAAAPLDRQASVIRDGSGDLWEANVPATVNRWLAPPALKPVETFLAGASADLAKELIGKRFGRLTVLGVWADGNPKKNATWVCRCDCGYYEGRKVRGLQGGGEDQMACHACVRLIWMQRSASKNTKATRKASAAMLDQMAAAARR